MRKPNRARPSSDAALLPL
jgi:hypothetical protein